jgi:hypothetical protein
MRLSDYILASAILAAAIILFLMAFLDPIRQ